MKLQDLYNVRWTFIKRTTFAWFTMLDKLGYRPGPKDVVAASGMTFLFVCERFKVDPREVLNVCDRIISSATLNDPQYPRGIREYMKEQFLDD